MGERAVDVTVAGHICLDLTPVLGEVAGDTAAQIFRPGTLLSVDRAEFSPGGPVSNTGLALRRLGLRVALMGKCGDDPFGQILLEQIHGEAPGAEQGMAVLPNRQTSFTIVLVAPGMDRIFLHCPGANHTFGTEDLDRELLEDTRLFHFGYPPLMRRMFRSGGQELRKVMQKALEAGAVTSLDLALPDPDTEAGRADWCAVLENTLPFVNFFMPSAEELLYMLRPHRLEEIRDGFKDPLDGLRRRDLDALARESIQMGAEVVVIKCGHLGAYIQAAEAISPWRGIDQHAAGWAGIDLFERAYTVTEVASATGSGDSAIAGFLAALCRGEGPRRCMRYLAAVGAHNLGELSAVEGVRSWKETTDYIRSEPPENPLPPGFTHGQPDR